MPSSLRWDMLPMESVLDFGYSFDCDTDLQFLPQPCHPDIWDTGDSNGDLFTALEGRLDGLQSLAIAVRAPAPILPTD